MKTINELTKKVLEIAKKNQNGFTLNIRTLQPITTGYVVSYKETQNSFSANNLQSVINHAINHDGIIGGWYNEKNKRYYFDSNKVFDNLEDAIHFGTANEQLAIFDLYEGKPIRLDSQAFMEKKFNFSTFAEWMLNEGIEIVKHYKGDILIDSHKIVELRNKCIFNLQSDVYQGFSLYWGVRECGTWLYHIGGDNAFNINELQIGLGAKKIYLIDFWFDSSGEEIITVKEVDKESI